MTERHREDAISDLRIMRRGNRQAEREREKGHIETMYKETKYIKQKRIVGEEERWKKRTERRER